MPNKFTSILARIGIFAVLLAIFFWLQQDPQRDETGAIVQAGNIDPGELFAGDCYKEEQLFDLEVSEEEEPQDQLSVDAVPCASKHNNEIFATFSSLTSIELDQDVFTQMLGQCEDAFFGYIGLSENTPEDDLMKLLGYFDEYQFVVVFTRSARAETEPDPRKPFSCILNNMENFTDFSFKGFLAL